MRTLCAVLAALALTGLSLAAAGASATPSPALRAKRAQAAQVLAQVNRLDRQFGALVDAWDGARIQLAAAEKQLTANRLQLTVAQRDSRIATQRVAQMLVTIYEGENPDLIELLAGSSRLSDVINAVQYTRDVSTAAERVAAAAARSKQRLADARRKLQATERSRRSTVSQLASERAAIETMLAQRRRLLSSVQSEVDRMQAQEEAAQRRAAAAARARLAAEQVRLQQQAQARARAAAAQALRAATTTTAAAAAAAPPPSPTTTGPTTTGPASTAPASTDPTTATATVATATTASAPLPAGYPQAALIALRYIGIPYQWGGASPATGFDCSGLVMYVYAQLGVLLPHFAAAQYGYGTPVPRADLQPGDLVFFDGLSHVGIYIGNGQMVHAPQTGDFVKITPLSQFGPNYVGARRL
ncbi:MAG TPA: C40 family peptidase [Gaiellaceae bacterium]|nr:C40 family peptidase [Gaiellaceae bacterium]